MGPNVTAQNIRYLAPPGGHCNVTEGPPSGAPSRVVWGPPEGPRCMLCRGPRREAWLRWNSFFPENFLASTGHPSRVSRELFGFHWAHPSRFFPGDFETHMGMRHPESPEIPDFPRGNESPVCPRARFFPEKFLGPAGSPGDAEGVPAAGSCMRSLGRQHAHSRAPRGSPGRQAMESKAAAGRGPAGPRVTAHRPGAPRERQLARGCALLRLGPVIFFPAG
jgi:hypothetical protein